METERVIKYHCKIFLFSLFFMFIRIKAMYFFSVHTCNRMIFYSPLLKKTAVQKIWIYETQKFLIPLQWRVLCIGFSDQLKIKQKGVQRCAALQARCEAPSFFAFASILVPNLFVFTKNFITNNIFSQKNIKIFCIGTPTK